MSSVNSYKDTDTAYLLNQIRKHILQNQAGRTASNDFTKTHIIPANDSIAFTDTATATEKGLVFKITNDAGGGVTSGQEGKIAQSLITNGNWCVIAAETANGYGAGIHVPGIIDTGEIHADD